MGPLRKPATAISLLFFLNAAFRILAQYEGLEMSSASKADYNAKRIVCIQELKAEYHRVVGSLLKGNHVVLLDTVDHGNLGDSFIQVGEVILMKELGTPPRRACSVNNCNFSAIKAEVQEFKNRVVVCIHGGGNLGDFWRKMTLFKHKITQMFADVPIVFLPQSIYYRKQANAEIDNKIFSRHKNLTILVRDFDSLEIAKKAYPKIPSHLSPDAAFMIGPIHKQCTIKYDILILARGDLEKNANLGDSTEASKIFRSHKIRFARLDWFSWKDYLGNRNKSTERLEWTQFHLDVAVDLFCMTRVVVTDRLHATILSTLMGLPHVFLDNQSRKINAYREANFGPRENCQDKYVRGFSARKWDEAAEMALVLLKQVKEQSSGS